VKAGPGDGPSSPSSGSADTGDAIPTEIILSLADVNPFPPLLFVLWRRNNVTMLIASGTTHFHPASPRPPALTRTSSLFFAFGYCVAYTCSRTLPNAYNYDALRTGLVLLSFGAGSMLGSVLGGRWSDRELRRLTCANGGCHSPEVWYPFLDHTRVHRRRESWPLSLSQAVMAQYLVIISILTPPIPRVSSIESSFSALPCTPRSTHLCRRSSMPRSRVPSPWYDEPRATSRPWFCATVL